LHSPIWPASISWKNVIVVYRQVTNYSAISWRLQVCFNEMSMKFYLYWTHTLSWISMKHKCTAKHGHSSQTHYDSEQNNRCKLSLMVRALRSSNKYQFYCCWFDPISHMDSNRRSTPLEAHTLGITPPMLLTWQNTSGSLFLYSSLRGIASNRHQIYLY
jgi:hypothetical protein